TEFQIPRNSLAWMLAAQVAVIAPHVPRLAPWIIVVCLGCGLWRIMVFLGRWSYPGRWTKVLFVLVGIIGVPIGYGRHFFQLEPAVALLIVAFVLKLLEMHHKRDAFIVIFLAYFVLTTEFLYSQTIPTSIYMGLVMAMITAALIGLNQTQGHLKPVHTFKLAGVLLGQSVPLMVVLFILFPRVGPLWTVPLQSQSARTGISDNMSPGDIASLTQSDELAFRVTFAGEVPPNSQLYWRGLVFSRYDGTSWSQARTGYGPTPVEWANNLNADWDSLIERRGKPVSYSVILEPTNQNWLFALPTPVPLTEGIGLVRDFRLYSLKPVQSRLRYEVVSFLDHRTERELSDYWRSRMTSLPQKGNPLSWRLATQLRGQSSSSEQFISRILLMFNVEEFTYTLKPPLLGEDEVDDFIMVTKRGFCEHFASSFVFMMRAAKIPARVVVGYQGGEFNPIGNYLAVHQFDAHAWAEVWIEGEGWRRVDPTSVVAPERIEDGLQAAVDDEQSFLEDSPLSWFKYSQTLWLTELRLQLSAIGHYWDAWIVGYNPTMQVRFLGQFMGEVNIKKIGITLFVTFGSVLLCIALLLLKKRKATPLDSVSREYLAFCGLMEKLGFGRQIGEGPIHYAERIGSHRPEMYKAVREVTDIYVDLNYSGRQDPQSDELKRAVRAFRLRLMAANV
ncbi:MAG: DUF3488 and transglutaminase-like domain-containing protein, partial [Pseudomonadales bacterium]|nr:DUF3488 and transglutaminase-like domain-containing protein [Pseudomonadales bacterium]